MINSGKNTNDENKEMSEEGNRWLQAWLCFMKSN